MEFDVLPVRRAAGRSAVLVCTALLSAGGVGAAQPVDLRGFVSEGIAGGLYFQRCEAAGPSATQVLLDDKSHGGLLTAGLGEVRRAMPDAERPIYVEFRGDTADKVATARQFHRAVGHVVSCSGVSPLAGGVQLFAEGTQPAWRVQATPTGAKLERVGHKPVQFAPAKLTATDTATKSRTYVSAAAPGGTYNMRLEVTEQACNDTAAESAFGARVVAQWGDQRFEGCAARF